VRIGLGGFSPAFNRRAIPAVDFSGPANKKRRRKGRRFKSVKQALYWAFMSFFIVSALAGVGGFGFAIASFIFSPVDFVLLSAGFMSELMLDEDAAGAIVAAGAAAAGSGAAGAIGAASTFSVLPPTFIAIGISLPSLT
jgi:hypothetical protein